MWNRRVPRDEKIIRDRKIYFKPNLEERNLSIYNDRLRGKTYREIGSKYKLSKDRVSIICWMEASRSKWEEFCKNNPEVVRCHVSVRTYNSLFYEKNPRIKQNITFAELSQFTESQLLKRRGFGNKSLAEVKKLLSDRNLSLHNSGEDKTYLCPKCSKKFRIAEKFLKDFYNK